MPGLILPHSAASMYRAAAASGDMDSISDLVLWWRADDESSITDSAGDVTSWADQVSSVPLTASSAGQYPSTGTRSVNFLNAVDFDGTANWLALNFTYWPNFSGAETIVITFVVDSMSPNGNIIGGTTASRHYVSPNYINLGDTNLIAAASTGVTTTLVCGADSQSATATQFLKTGTETYITGTVNHNYSEPSNINIGSANDGNSPFFNGAICEIALYSRELSTAEKNQAAGIQKTRWNSTWSDI